MADESARDDTLRFEAAIDRYWDAVADGRLAKPDRDLDERLAATIRRVHALAGQPLPEPDRAERLWRSLMSGYASTVTWRSAPGAQSPTNGFDGTASLAPRLIALPRREPSRIASGLLFVATVALVTTVLGLMFYLYRSEQRVALPPAQDAATPTVTSGAWPIYRGNPARTGEMPGPGVAGSPTIVWQFAAGASTRFAPAVAEGTVFLPADGGTFFALDAATGDVKWQTDGLDAMPSVSDGLLYMVSRDDVLLALDTVTQEELWRYAPGSRIWTPLIADGVLFYGGDPDLVVALDPRTGAERWRSAQTGVASRSLALADGIVVVGSEDQHVYGLDQATGATRWRYELGDGAAVIQTPAILDGVVYVGTFDGNRNAFAALDLQTGQQRWRLDGEGTESFWAPGAADGVVYVPSDAGKLLALDAATGEPRWTLASTAPMTSGPAIVDGVVYVAGDDGMLRALDAATGTERWRLPLDGGVAFGPVIVDGRLYVSTLAGTLYAIAAGDASAAASAATPAGPSVATPTTGDPTTTGAAGPVEVVWAASGNDQNRLEIPIVARLSPDGKLWVSDTSGRFFIVDLDGNLLEVWGANGSGPGEFSFTDLQFDSGTVTFLPDGSFYVVDSFNRRVQHFDRDRRYLGEWGTQGSGDGQFLLPTELALLPDGTLLVADYLRNDIQRFDPNGAFLGKFDGAGTPEGPFGGPLGLKVDAAGRLYVVEYDANRIRIVDQAGATLGVLGANGADFGGFDAPSDLAFDENGFAFVSDSENHRIAVFDPQGRFVYAWGEPGSGDGQFDRTGAVAVNKGATVYVVDWNGGRIQKFKITGPFPTPAATPAP